MLWLILCLAGCATQGGDAGQPLAEDARESEIEALEVSIGQARAALAELVTRPRDIERDPLHEDPTLRSLADRLARDTARLDALRAEASADAEAQP